jgi:hypothetical protein
MTTLLSVNAVAETLDLPERQILALVNSGELIAVDVAVHAGRPGRITCTDGIVRRRQKRRLRITAASLRDFISRRQVGQPKAARRYKPESNVIQLF